MINEKLKLLICNNNIEVDTFQGCIYNTILLSIFEEICLRMKDSNIRQKVLSQFHKSHNYLETVEEVIFKYTRCRVSRDESEIIFKWLIAYFRKDGKRKKYDKSFRIDLLLNQNNKCNICGKTISIDNSELDHIIPWDFVGDELDGNLQMLCNNCNERKGRSIEFQLKMLLIDKAQ